jgi:hypothetical protein
MLSGWRGGGVVADRPGRGGGYPGQVDGYWVAVVWAILPTTAVCVVFFFVLRGILRMDRTERRVYARIEAEERAKRGLPPLTDDAPPAASSSR